MRVVVVGASGGIGSQVAYLLRVDGHEIIEARFPDEPGVKHKKFDAWVFAQGSHEDCFHVNYGLVTRWWRDATDRPNVLITMSGGAVGGKVDATLTPDYVASKAAMVVWTEWAAQRFGECQFFCVAPGLTATKMTGYKGADPRVPAAFIVKLLSGKYGHLSGSLLAAQRDDLDTMKPMKLRRVECP